MKKREAATVSKRTMVRGRQDDELQIVITGASSGIGAALARSLAARRCTLSLIGRNEDRLTQVVAECASAGSKAHGHICDVTDAAAMKACILAADDRRAIDMIIANAGIGGRDAMAPAGGETIDQARRILETNLFGVLHTFTPVLDRLIQRRAGQLVIVSSMMAYRGFADAPVYSASKAAARIYGQGLQQLLGPHGVRVLIACPGFVATPMSQTLPFATPFLVTAEDAATRILAAVSSGRKEIAFPWQLRSAAQAANLLPSWIVDPLLRASRERLAKRHGP